MSDFVDLHSHVLPGLDDGARDAKESEELLRGLRALGFSQVCATPHQKTGQFLPSAESIRVAYEQTVETATNLGLKLHLAAENFWDDLLAERLAADALPCYPDRRSFLFEFHPLFTPVQLENQLFRIQSRGLLPVLAHPERYRFLWNKSGVDEVRVRGLAQQCALVVDLAALDGSHGEGEARVAADLVGKGLVHAVTSDVHRLPDLRSAGAGMQWIEKRFGAKRVEQLLVTGPQAILTGTLPSLAV